MLSKQITCPGSGLRGGRGGGQKMPNPLMYVPCKLLMCVVIVILC